MNRAASRLIVLAVAVAPLAAQAAPQACDLVGTVDRVSETVAVGESAVYAFEFVIADARAAASGAAGDACGAHVGQRMDVDLTLPARVGVPRAGDRVAFSRTADTGVGGDAYIDYHFTALNPPSAAD